MYDYEALKKQISEINPIVTEVFQIGQSVMERALYCLKTGRGKKKLLLTGAHHGLEYITSEFLMKFISEYASCAINDKEMFGKNIRDFFSKVSLYIIPMINPDGVDIAVNGLDITNKYHRRLISSAGIHSFRKVWQANVNGVDLNHNYNALWHNVINSPAPSLYGGECYESEPETIAICKFLRNEQIDMLVCFHSQGEEIYYDFDGCEPPKSKKIAKQLSKVSGYKISKPVGSAVCGGCKDWFIKEFGRVGLTIEVGKGKNPLPDNAMKDIFPKNAQIILACIEEIGSE